MTGGDLDAIRIIWIIIFGEGAKVNLSLRGSKRAEIS